MEFDSPDRSSSRDNRSYSAVIFEYLAIISTTFLPLGFYFWSFRFIVLLECTPPAPARRWAASCFDEFLSSKKSHSWPVECVGAAIGRPPAWRSSAFSGKVFHRQTGTGEQCSPLQEFFCSLKKNCKPAICRLAIFLSPAEGLFRRSLPFTARPAQSARG